MVDVSAAIEHDTGDPGCNGPLGNRFAHGTSGFDIAAGLSSKGFLGRRRVGKRLPVNVVDHLSVNVIQAAVDSKAWPFGCAANFFADAGMNALSDVRSALL
jgi:hypothetical protein